MEILKNRGFGTMDVFSALNSTEKKKNSEVKK